MKISVITATYNAEKYLPDLIDSLQNQTDKDFEWVVADGASTDRTLEYLQSIEDLNFKVLSEEDFGIYDALNRAIKASSGDFYLVVGADDFLNPDAISKYKSYASEGIDVVTACVLHRDKVIGIKKQNFSFLNDAWSYVGSHSVGCLFKRELHDKYGFYSKRFPIAADQYFINKLVSDNRKIYAADFIAGRFGDEGVSSVDVKGHLSETFRVQYESNNNKKTQFFLYLARLIKNKLLGKF